MATNSSEATLTCKLCSELYSDPRMLPCLHSFCSKCLLKAVEEQGASCNSLKCPTCDATSQLPSGGSKGLRKNLWLAHEVEIGSFQCKIEKESNILCNRSTNSCSGSAVTFCCNCSLFLCASCEHDHHSWQELGNHKLVDLEQAKKNPAALLVCHKTKPCPWHSKKNLKFYCKTCECLVCRDCLAITHKDCEHDYIEDAAKKECDDLSACLKKTEKVLTKLDTVTDLGEKTIQQINSRKNVVMEEIKQVFGQLEKAVEERRKTMQDQCEKVTASKINAVSCQMKHLESLRQRIALASKVAANALQMPNEMLSTKKLIKDELVQSCSQFEEMFLDMVENENIATSQMETKSAIDSVSKVGEVFAPLDSSILVERSISIPHACVGKQTKMMVAVDLQPSSDNQQRLIQAYDSTTSMKVNVSKVKDGRVSLSFVPRKTGQRVVHIRVQGEKSSCGPFPIWVQEDRNYMSLSVQQIFNVGSTTYGAAVHPNGEVFASNYRSHYIQVFKKNGSQKLHIGSSGSMDGQLSRPWGLALVGDVLYVVENSNHRIHKFSITGEYVGKFGSNGSANKQFSYPRGICIDSMGHILVADTNNKRVQVFNTHDDSFAYSIPCTNSPYDVAVDNTGNIHVALYDNHHIQVFSPDGQQVLGTYDGNGKIKSPAGIAIGADGHKFIVDRTNKCLHILDTSNTQVACFSGLSGPYAVTIDTHGYIYVADSSSSRILKY